MRRAIVGTAGHIDHGKTRLIEALTGIDCDRLAEEKARGITIDLGFAWLVEGDPQLGFVDVPGHERFLHNALAGLGGIRLMLLVVAADEGVKPQTREHVAICSLLGIPAAVVALTKSDLVSGDLLELAQLEVEELLQATPFAGAPIVPVSAVTGDGLPRLRELLVERAGEVAVPADAARPARLPIDRAFHLKGLGVVVTGTLASGRVTVGDELAVVPGERSARVRSVQVHGSPRDEALAGERTSLQLAGVELGELERGQQLAPAGALATTHRLLARCTWLPDAGKPLAGWMPVRVHLLAAETLGKARALDPAELAPGATGIVELRLDRPLAAVRGDRLVLRRPSPPATLGGGEVLDPLWRRRRGRQRDEAAAALAGGVREALRLWVEEAGEGGATAEELARRLGVAADVVRPELSALAGEQRLLKVPAPNGEVRWLSPAVVQRVTARAKRVLKEYFQRERLADGMPRAEAVRRILRGRGGEVADRYFEWLAAQRVLAVAGDRINLPGRRAELSGDESRLATQVLAAYESAGLTPPSPAELAKGLNAKQQIFDGVVRYLRQQGRLAQLPGGLLVSRDALDKLVAALRGTGWERFSVPQFKDRFELSRKWAIPLLEHLDSIAVTRRVGDDRQLVR
ncbi:MAG TPA: selenocysteine-specific translation elongation factor [Thermoanaerobaculia bacterium]|jgi:selenocysteine-specific elongation factor|nr:selenocysteine-specific translation elongation factor [Thermoanaerobaculia bacterium]